MIQGTGLAGHTITVTITNHHADGTSTSRSRETQATSGTGWWALMLQDGDIHPGALVTIVAADKSAGVFVYRDFNTIETLTITGPVAGANWPKAQRPAWSGTAKAGDTITFAIRSNDPNKPYQITQITGSTVVDSTGHWSYGPSSSDVPYSGPVELAVRDSTNGDVQVVAFNAT